jgi:hypothetical protein
MIGDKSFGAWMRLGLAELHQAASMGGNVEQPTPYGMFGNPTPGQVDNQPNPDLPTPSQVIDNPTAYLPAPSPGQERGHDQGHER